MVRNKGIFIDESKEPWKCLGRPRNFLVDWELSIAIDNSGGPSRPFPFFRLRTVGGVDGVSAVFTSRGVLGETVLELKKKKSLIFTVFQNGLKFKL